MSFTSSQKFSHYLIRRVRTIYEKQVSVCYSLLSKSAPIIHFFVKSNHFSNINLSEYWRVFLRGKSRSLAWCSFIYRAHKCHKFPRNYPIQITILYSLKMLILFGIESSEIIPTLLYSEFKALEAMQHLTIIETFTFRSIPEWF